MGFQNCQTPHTNEDPKDQFGLGVTLKSKRPPPPTQPPVNFFMVIDFITLFKTFLKMKWGQYSTLFQNIS